MRRQEEKLYLENTFCPLRYFISGNVGFIGICVYIQRRGCQWFIKAYEYMNVYLVVERSVKACGGHKVA